VARLFGDEADKDDWRQRLEDVIPAIRSANVAGRYRPGSMIAPAERLKEELAG